MRQLYKQESNEMAILDRTWNGAPKAIIRIWLSWTRDGFWELRCTLKEDLELVGEKYLFFAGNRRAGLTISHGIHETHAMELNLRLATLAAKDLSASTTMVLKQSQRDPVSIERDFKG